MVANADRKKDPQELLREMEAERKEMEERFTIKAGEAERLREQEVLSKIMLVMFNKPPLIFMGLYRGNAICNGGRDAKRTSQKRVRSWKTRCRQPHAEHVSKKWALAFKTFFPVIFWFPRDVENDRAVEGVLTAKGKQQQELISGLLENEKYQRDAFGALFMKQDTKNKEISLQVEQIQNELASLSMVEMTKKDLKVEFENDVMAEKRETLTQILVELMNQKKQRQEELTKRLEEMEQTRSAEQDNYWLIQYQKLLDSKPKVKILC